MAVSEQLRRAIERSGETHYRIAKDTGLSAIAVTRFVSGERPYLRSDTLDRLCEYLGLQLCPAPTSQAGATASTAGSKQRSKSA